MQKINMSSFPMSVVKQKMLKYFKVEQHLSGIAQAIVDSPVERN